MKSHTRWLLLVYQLPSTPSNLRVQTWRRLQQLGALPVKQAVYVLPDTASTREDFEWLKAEIDGLGGHATVFAADGIDDSSNDELIDAFRRAREEDYASLEREVKRIRRPRRRGGTAWRRGVMRQCDAFQRRFSGIEAIDFFGAQRRDRVARRIAALRHLTEEAAPGPTTLPPRVHDKRTYAGRVWVTRPRPGVDRMASAWLIRRFIDPQARFAFATDPGHLRDRQVPFDMYGVVFGHHGAFCTFETLQHVFTLTNPAISRIAAIVHDLDLKDARFGAPEATTVAALIDGLQARYSKDDVLLAQGMNVFEALHTAFVNSNKAPARRARARRPRAKTPRR